MKRIIATVLFLFVTPWAVRALDTNAPWDVRDAEWERVFDESSSLHRYNQNERAVVMAAKAIQLAEERWGPGHFHVAQSLLLLGCCLEDQGQHAKAEAAYIKAMAIVEKTDGMDAPTVAGYAFCLSGLYRRTGREKEADALDARGRELLRRQVFAQQKLKAAREYLPDEKGAPRAP